LTAVDLWKEFSVDDLCSGSSFSSCPTEHTLSSGV
jgi:hypothetical protein